MDTSVKLQNLFSYSKTPIFIVLGIFVLILAFLILSSVITNRKKKKKMIEKPVVIIPLKSNVSFVKQNYINQLSKIAVDFQQGICSVRDSYQQMSAIIRGFVQEVTGIKVQNYTLQDIKFLQLPVLEELIEEYYSPEFACESEGDVLTSIEKTKGAIERWN